MSERIKWYHKNPQPTITEDVIDFEQVPMSDITLTRTEWPDTGKVLHHLVMTEKSTSFNEATGEHEDTTLSWYIDRRARDRIVRALMNIDFDEEGE